ncbi:hypothetical protein NDI52_04245 [Leptolyngbya sp. PL-A3]|uniref:hypothetical protein n=1 Tax=Leptolyngbya sp. FACHB-8 TaxID=2692814 RepID=UPI001A7EE031|nr:hypothetical protein [Leptolyngbya sp. FACHB-8]
MSKLQNRFSWMFWSGFYLSLGSFGLLGCNRLPDLIATGSKTSEAATASPPPANMLCETPGYLAKVTTLQGQPHLTFGPKPDANTLTDAAPVAMTENDDGSRTYSISKDSTTYARFYLDGTCLTQVVAADSTVSVEEVGKTSPVDPPDESVASSSLEQPDQYQQGYDLGYKEGFQSGETFRREKRENTPELAFPADSASGNESYDRGYREGFYDGFAGGYDSFISQEPNQNNLAMSCAGTIVNKFDFTAYYTRESGFNRIDLKPHQSSQTLTANLSYDRKDDKNHEVWRGNIAQMEDVTLTHLSTKDPKPGDEVSVSYDNGLGKANCR